MTLAQQDKEPDYFLADFNNSRLIKAAPIDLSDKYIHITPMGPIESIEEASVRILKEQEGLLEEKKNLDRMQSYLQIRIDNLQKEALLALGMIHAEP